MGCCIICTMYCIPRTVLYHVLCTVLCVLRTGPCAVCFVLYCVLYCKLYCVLYCVLCWALRASFIFVLFFCSSCCWLLVVDCCMPAPIWALTLIALLWHLCSI